MARNGSGVYSLPGGSTVANGDTSDASDINTPLNDIVDDLNAARPIVAGGTGATSASAARDNLGTSSKVLSKSSAYTAVAGDRSKVIRCTATMTLSLTAAATLGDGWFAHVVADGGAVTVDPDGAETIDGAATLALADGGSAIVHCDGTGFYTVGAGATFPTITVAGAADLDGTLNVSGAVTLQDTLTATGNTALGGTLNVSGAVTLQDALTLDGVTVAGVVIESEGISSNDNDTTVPTSAAVKDYADGTVSAASSGYAALPGGLIIQWGSTSALGEASTAVTFPTAFSTGCYAVVANPSSAFANNGDRRDSWHVGSISTSGFTLTSRLEVTSATYNWIAVGV